MWKYLESVYLKEYNKTWFTDRAKAEAKLKELQGGNNLTSAKSWEVIGNKYENVDFFGGENDKS